MCSLKMQPFWLKLKCANYTEECDAAEPLRDLILKLDQIKVLLQEEDEENSSNQHWKKLAERINLVFCFILLAIDVVSATSNNNSTR